MKLNENPPYFETFKSYIEIRKASIKEEKLEYFSEKITKDKLKEYLERIERMRCSDSGETKLHEAALLVKKEFKLNEKEAGFILHFWSEKYTDLFLKN